MALLFATLAVGLQGCAIGNNFGISNSRACQTAMRRLTGDVKAAQPVDFDQDHVPDCIVLVRHGARKVLYAWNGRQRKMTDLGTISYVYGWSLGSLGTKGSAPPPLIEAAGWNRALVPIFEMYQWRDGRIKLLLKLCTRGKVTLTNSPQHYLWPLVTVKYRNGIVAEYTWNGVRYVKTIKR